MAHVWKTPSSQSFCGDKGDEDVLNLVSMIATKGLVLSRAATNNIWIKRIGTRKNRRLTIVAKLRSDPTLVDDHCAPLDFEQSALVYPDVISESEERAILLDLQSKMKRRRYERGHWDDVIVKYKEVELQLEDNESFSDITREVVARIRKQLAETFFPNDSPLIWLPCHAIQLHADGELKPHVDSVRFSGDLVAGLSLGSCSIMRLQPVENGLDTKDNEMIGEPGKKLVMDKHNSPFVDLLLQPRSLYAMTGSSRYQYTHELRPSDAVFLPTNTVVKREDRFSVIFRDRKKEERIPST